MRDLFQDTAVDLLDPGLAVDDDVIEIIYQKADDLPEIGVDRAVAACGFRPADREKCKPVGLLHRVKKAETRFSQYVLRVLELSRHILRDASADLVERLRDLDAERDGQADRGIRVDREDAGLRFFFCENADERGGERCLSDAALARQGDYDILCIHSEDVLPMSDNFETGILQTSEICNKSQNSLFIFKHNYAQHTRECYKIGRTNKILPNKFSVNILLYNQLC